MKETQTAIASLFLLLLVGYGAKKANVLKAQDEAVVNQILVYITMPAFIFINTVGKPLTPEMVKTPVLGLLVEGIIIALAYVASRLMRLDRRTAGALMIVSAFGNTGYLGYPVAKAAFPTDEHGILTAVLFDNFAMRIALITVGVAIATNSAGERFEWRSVTRLLRTPLVPAAVLGLVFRNCQMPLLISKVLDYLAAPTVPLSLLSLGLSVSTGAVRRYPLAIAAAVVLKMGLFPLGACGIKGTVGGAALLEAAMPPAVFSGVVSSQFGANGRFAAGAVFLGTVLSAVSIPIILGVMQ